MCGRGSRRLGVFRRRSLTWRVSFFGLSRAVQRRTRHAAHADPQVGGMGRNRSLGASNGVEPIVTHAQARSALAPLPLRSRSAPAPQSHAPPTRTGARSRRGAGRGLSSGVPGDLRPSTPPDGAKRPSARGSSSTPIPRMTCTILLHPPPSGPKGAGVAGEVARYHGRFCFCCAHALRCGFQYKCPRGIPFFFTEPTAAR